MLKRAIQSILVYLVNNIYLYHIIYTMSIAYFSLVNLILND
jgi:hypothetical protein